MSLYKSSSENSANADIGTKQFLKRRSLDVEAHRPEEHGMREKASHSVDRESAHISKSQPTFPFRKLPQELQNEIYEYLLQQPDGCLFFNSERQRFSAKKDRYEAPDFSLNFVAVDIARDTFFLPLKLNGLCFGNAAVDPAPWDDQARDPVSELLQFWGRLTAVEASTGLVAHVRLVELRIRVHAGADGELYCFSRPWKSLLQVLGDIINRPQLEFRIVVEHGHELLHPLPNRALRALLRSDEVVRRSVSMMPGFFEWCAAVVMRVDDGMQIGREIVEAYERVYVDVYVHNDFFKVHEQYQYLRADRYLRLTVELLKVSMLEYMNSL